MTFLKKTAIFVLAMISFIAGYAVMSEVIRSSLHLREIVYKPYCFSEQHFAELAITTLIRALENGSYRNIYILLDKETDSADFLTKLKEFCAFKMQSENEQSLIIKPDKIFYNHTKATMNISVKRLNSSVNTRTQVDVVFKENEWLIEPTSNLFKVLFSHRNIEREREVQK